nr:MMS19 nucleotide excision repair protein homolog isoform X1 [Ipomoea batatas]
MVAVVPLPLGSSGTRLRHSLFRATSPFQWQQQRLLSGILLIGELLTQLSLKPLTDAAIQKLIGLFIERLADWKALRGALVGCLALLRRKFDVGMVTQSQAMAAAQSFLENMQVQSLGQHDRKVYYLNLPSELSISFLQLCFQILECLLNFHPDAVEPLLSYIAMLEVSAFIFL